jgi:predicted sulfurtransferase
VLGPPPATAPRAAASGSRAFGPAYAPRDGSGPVSSTPSLRRRVAGLRVVVSASGDVQDTAAAETTANAGTRDGQKVKGSHQLLTFFCFTQVPDYEKELEDHRAFIAENNLELRGRIYLNQQGINAQMSGRGTDGEKYARWVESREHFNGMRISVYPVDEQAHPKLSLRYKPQLVQLEGGTAHLPVHDPKRRGTPLSPEEWHAKMSDVLDEKPDAPLLLDVRNGYEWDVGHFRGAQRPVQESFRETVETNVADRSATDPNGSNKGPLAGVDKSKPIMMYCTGGIRCDVYSTVLKEQGYENVFTLEGGVQAYFDEFGNKGGPEVGRSVVRVRLATGDDPDRSARRGSRRRRGDARVLLLRRAESARAASQLPQRGLQQAVPGVPGVPDVARGLLLRRVRQGQPRAPDAAAAGAVPEVRALHRGRGDVAVGAARRRPPRAAAPPPRAQEARTRREGRVARGCRSEASRPASRRARAREGGGEPGRVREERGLGDARRAHAEHRESRGAPWTTTPLRRRRTRWRRTRRSARNCGKLRRRSRPVKRPAWTCARSWRSAEAMVESSADEEREKRSA